MRAPRRQTVLHYIQNYCDGDNPFTHYDAMVSERDANGNLLPFKVGGYRDGRIAAELLQMTLA